MVQDRYVGDVGDFVTYALLRVLCGAGVGRLGVVWYLVADETHNTDGRHVAYLDPGNRIGQRLRACDPALFEAMRAIVATGRRRVASVERSGVLPVGTRFYAPHLRRGRRDRWFSGALRATADCDVVFLDPDNGISFTTPATPEKYATVDELVALVDRGQSVVVYQHAQRSTSVERQAATLLLRLAGSVSVTPLAAVLARRGTVRMFVLLPQPRHRDAFTTALRQLEATPWAAHLQSVHHRED